MNVESQQNYLININIEKAEKVNLKRFFTKVKTLKIKIIELSVLACCRPSVTFESCIVMDPSEIEFIAEKTPIEIIPNFNHVGQIHLISGKVGPFRAGLPMVVPLWLGINLKQRNKCRILSPEWMNVDKLEEKKEEEKNSKLFTKMPLENYLEVTHLLLKVASDDINRADEIRTLIKDLWDMRISKLRSSVDTFINSGGTHASLAHLTQLEINSIRPLLPDTLNMLQSMQQGNDSDEEEANDASQNTTRHHSASFQSSSGSFQFSSGT